MRKLLLASLLGLLIVNPLHAKDLGVQGQVWPILEIDFRRLMLESAARVDWNQMQDEIKSSANKYFDGFPGRRLPSVDKTETRYIDPSIITPSDIMAPLPDASGTLQWSVLYAKGTRVNPLEKIRPLTAMLFFDGNSPDQVKFVRAALAANPLRVVPVETAGANVKDLSVAFDRPVFYANESMMARFRVEHLPALLYPGSGANALYLGLTAFAEPYKASELETAWPVNPVVQPVVNVTPVSAAERKAVSDLLRMSPKENPNAK